MLRVIASSSLAEKFYPSSISQGKSHSAYQHRAIGAPKAKEPGHLVEFDHHFGYDAGIAGLS
jgi:hypothetical protein